MVSGLDRGPGPVQVRLHTNQPGGRGSGNRPGMAAPLDGSLHHPSKLLKVLNKCGLEAKQARVRARVEADNSLYKPSTYTK